VDDVASARLLSVGFLCHVPVRTGEALPASASTAPTACSPAIARFSLVLVWQPFGHGAAASRRFLHVRARGTVGSRGATHSEGYSLQAATLLDSQQSKGEVNPLSISPPSPCLPDQYNAT
jgi:hypothetical protein